MSTPRAIALALATALCGCRERVVDAGAPDAGARLVADPRPDASAAVTAAPAPRDAGPVMEPWSREKELARRHPSPDGARVAYQDGKGGLWVAGADGSNAKRVLDAHTARVENPPFSRPLADCELFSIIAWAPDDRRIYVVAPAWGNSPALYSLDLGTGAVRFLHAALALGVVHRCSDPRQVGRLLVFEHTGYGDLHPIGDEWILLDARGKVEGEIGLDDASVDRFLARSCGIGVAPADPSLEVPARLEAGPFQCGKYRMRYEPRRFLDGTEYPLFRWDLTGPRGPDDMVAFIGRLDITLETVKRDCPDLLR